MKYLQLNNSQLDGLKMLLNSNYKYMLLDKKYLNGSNIYLLADKEFDSVKLLWVSDKTYQDKDENDIFPYLL